ncbi:MULTISPECIES: 4-diphosphocytidyl-2C-methyl-D-erythritol kinase [Lysinibacillus]|uniref:4-diphosphocytidyl-2C-methyl-D-erythritol kinase n=1 Tax=Lysinibacillus antri TaxID=2498145 RepID=A0A432LEW7_9BACI|nr:MULTISPECIES: 4-diphosphocytidyl-2C-methyl-D-erythritol kinase [Lysinibacillus]RUL54279.1 4-diphosphocytidyl-2C-methyl-D-erythritol kinase [Lysinibacillus antri]TSI04222.1 4-diphosphocytidyl-2C-methyl-D-erythritol kinase [Lysinibacillus sp. BW-2-10]
MEEPLLFIPTPPFYYIEVEEAEQQPYEESTSVYEITRSERIKNLVIARQLSFFSQPINSNRLLRFYLNNGDSIIGKIKEVNGATVKVLTTSDIIEIDGNAIEIITTSR